MLIYNELLGAVSCRLVSSLHLYWCTDVGIRNLFHHLKRPDLVGFLFILVVDKVHIQVIPAEK